MDDPVTTHLDHARRADALREERLDPARRAELWTSIEASARGQPRRWAWAAGGALALASAAVAAALVVVGSAPVPRVIAGEVRGARGAAAPEWLEGSALEAVGDVGVELGADTLALDGGARWSLDGDRIGLEAGALVLSAHARSWVVVTGEAEIEVIGAEVRVERLGERTRVDAADGMVVVRAAGLAPREVWAPESVMVSRREASVGASAVPGRGAAPVAAPEAPGVAPPPAGEVRRAPRAEPALAPAPPREPEPTLAPAPEPRSDAAPRTLADARALLTRDNPRAQALAEGVLEHDPRPELRVSAQMIIADALRLQGQRAAAERAYARVVDSEGAGAFLEEALLRQAELLVELSRPADALAALGSGRAAGTTTVLLPERSVLAARIHLAGGRAARAASVLDALPEAGPLTLQRARLDVARALAPTDPARAARLLRGVVRAAPPPLADEARRALSALEAPPGDIPRTRDP